MGETRGGGGCNGNGGSGSVVLSSTVFPPMYTVLLDLRCCGLVWSISSDPSGDTRGATIRFFLKYYGGFA
jgi:hypothetical protein